jgi:flagellar basal body rod protein FlgB
VPSSSPVVAKSDTPPYSITDDEFAQMLEESLARSKTPKGEGIAANTTTSPPSGPSCSGVEVKGDTPAPYSITNDEFVQMLEESLAGGKTPD